MVGKEIVDGLSSLQVYFQMEQLMMERDQADGVIKEVIRKMRVDLQP